MAFKWEKGIPLDPVWLQHTKEKVTKWAIGNSGNRNWKMETVKTYANEC